MGSVSACGLCGGMIVPGIGHVCQNLPVRYSLSPPTNVGCRPAVYVTAEEVRTIFRDELTKLLQELVLTCAPREQKP